MNVCTYKRAYKRTYKHINVWTFVCRNVCLNIHLYEHSYVCLHVCTLIHTFIHTYVRMNVRINVWTYIQYCISYFLLSAESFMVANVFSRICVVSQLSHCYCMLLIYYLSITIVFSIQFSILMYLKFMSCTFTSCYVFFYSVIQLSYYIVNLYFI